MCALIPVLQLLPSNLLYSSTTLSVPFLHNNILKIPGCVHFFKNLDVILFAYSIGVQKSLFQQKEYVGYGHLFTLRLSDSV